MEFGKLGLCEILCDNSVAVAAHHVLGAGEQNEQDVTDPNDRADYPGDDGSNDEEDHFATPLLLDPAYGVSVTTTCPWLSLHEWSSGSASSRSA